MLNNNFIYVYFILFTFGFILQFVITTGTSERNVRGAIIWGPGLDSKIVLPARYFFIQALDRNGKNLTDSVGEKAFTVNIHAGDMEYARVWLQVLDRNDGSYIVRYKMFQSYTSIIIEVLYNGKHVGDSPYQMQGGVYHEKCYCPVSNFHKWSKSMTCPKSYKQIKQDLSIFKEIDMEAVAADAIERFNQRGRHSLCHYVIKDNQIYRRTFGEHVGFKMFMDAILLSMARKVNLPDLEFFVNLGDWPLETRRISENPIPILSWCGSEGSRDIVMPTYDVTESTLETLGRCAPGNLSLEMPTFQVSEQILRDTCRVTLDLLAVQANTGPKWQNKSSLAFWRGRDSRQERLDLVRMSRRSPDVIDAKLTNMFFFKHEEDLGELVSHISFFDFFKYKYQINLDGTVAAYRFPYLMGGDSVILKQDSDYYEHFYKQLEPFKHYIPFKRDLSDLMDMIQWAKDHDKEAEKIGKTAQEFLRDNLMATDVYCYHAVLFKEYAKKLTKPPKVLDDMELVEQPSDNDSKCHCHRAQKTRKKEEL